MNRVAGKAEIIIAKNRHGPTGGVEAKFAGQFARFEDPDDFDPNASGYKSRPSAPSGPPARNEPPPFDA